MYPNPNQNSSQPHHPGSGSHLTRYGSAPSSLFKSSDMVLGAGLHSSEGNGGVVAGFAGPMCSNSHGGGGGSVSSNLTIGIAGGVSSSSNLMHSPSSGLIRHSSSPPGFLHHLTTSNAEMDDIFTDTESLLAPIQHLVNENNELRKYVDELCTQQVGPRYLHIANGMHFQKTAGLEQEVLKLRKELTECKRDKTNLQKDILKASQINRELENLCMEEAQKKLEAVNQLKFFLSAATVDRNNAFKEATTAKENEYILSQTLHDCQQRLEELKSDAMKAQEHVSTLHIDISEMEKHSVLFKKVVDKFYQIKQHCLFDWEDEESSYIDKCSYLLHDPEESWSFSINTEDAATHGINSLQEECESLKELVDNLQSKIQMGLDIESDLKRKVCDLQNKMKMFDEFIANEIARLHQYISEQRHVISNLLDEGNSHVMSLFHELVKSFGLESLICEGLSSLQQNVRMPDENEFADMHTRIDSMLRSEVPALMRLQELEERHRQERKYNAMLLENQSDLQRSFKQVTAEKLEALMKLENLERELISGKTIHDGQQMKLPANGRDRAITSAVKEGRFANLLKRASFKRLGGVADIDGSDSSFHSVSEGYFSPRRSSNDMDVSRMKIEISTLNESLRSLEDLTSGIHKLRVSLVKAMEAFMSNDNASDNLMKSIEHIISEANIVQTSLCSSMPPSWADDGNTASSSHRLVDERGEGEDSRQVKIKSVSAAGFEMVELLLLAAQTMKDKASERRNRDKRLLKKVQ